MARYVFDLESDGLLDKLTKVHSLVLQDADTGEMWSCDNQYRATIEMQGAQVHRCVPVEMGLRMLMESDQIIGHNIIDFDIPAIQKVYPWFHIDEAKVFDTLVMSRLIWADLMDRDGPAVQAMRLKPKDRGSHSLRAWGQRLGELKGDFGDTTNWDEWSPEMQSYCERDVVVTMKLLELIEQKDIDPRAIKLEHEVATIIAEQKRTGFLFDLEKALDLLKVLQEERADVEGKLQSLFDPWYSFESTKRPTRNVNYKDVTRHSEWEGTPYCKIKLNVFNPGSRAHIADRLIKVRGWRPSETTASGQPKVDDEILGNLPYPEAQQIAYYLMLQKRLGQLYEGKNSWLNLLNPTTGRMHGSVVTNGAVTGRMTHNYPNVAQVPSVGKPYGKDCRSLFTVPAGKKLVGVDVSGLELRMLGHFLHPHDGGSYGDTVVNGDIHTVNQEAAGLPTRNHAKTFIYAFLYGAGNGKIGSIIGKGPKAGGVLKDRFLQQTPAIDKLVRGVSKAAKQKGYLIGLDGRILHIRHQHAALNTLLQSAGALVCKRWLVECEIERKRRGLTEKVKYVANVHDEIQYECDEDVAEEWGQISIECIKKAGLYFNIRVPLDGEAKVGNNWAECH